MNNKTITVCDNHSERLTPLIWTFAFPGAEYWCPHCGIVGGMFGTGHRVELTRQLIKTLRDDTKASKAFLFARAARSAVQIRYRGRWYEPKALPESCLKKNAKAIADWVYKGRSR